jgi:HK97 family phage prohead protease
VNMIHLRTASLELSEGQLFGRLVPLGVSARVQDFLPDGGLDIYDEGFRPGVFDRQLQTSDKAMLGRVGFWHTHDHGEGAGYFGPARSLEQRDDGIYGEFRVLTSKRNDLRDLMDEGHVDLSIEFRERHGGTSIDDNGVRWRTDAHLHGVVLDPRGAYPGAEVLSYRALAEQKRIDDEDRAAREVAERAEADARAAEQAAESARLAELAEIEAWLAAQTSS